jgi:hypothetical protein
MQRAIRVVFAIVGSLSMLFGVAVLTLSVLYPRVLYYREDLLGSAVYLAISAVCFYAVWRLRPRAVESRKPLGQLEIPEGHREELDRRLIAADADPLAGRPWEEVRARLRREK